MEKCTIHSFTRPCNNWFRVLIIKKVSLRLSNVHSGFPKIMRSHKNDVHSAGRSLGDTLFSLQKYFTLPK